MSVYYNLAKLGRVKLPSGTTYALIDVDCRKMITENYTSEASYSTGDLVIGTGLTGDNITFNDCLLRAKSDIPAGPFDSSKWEVVTVASEIHRLEDAIAGGIHYRGKTSTGLYDGSSTNPIVINDESYTAGAGDLVIVDRSSAAVNYAINTAYSAHTYVKYNSLYYITNAAITASENTSWSAVEAKMDVVKSDPMFLFDGTLWDLVDSESEGLGDLAYKDTASGTYRRPTGSGTVTIPTVAPSSEKLVTTSITPANGTVDATYVTGGTEKDIAKVGTAVRYGTANVGESVVYGTANRASSATVYGTADVGTEVEVGTSLTGTTTFNTDAIKSASLTGTKTFNTDAIKSATATGTDGTTAAKAGIITSVDGDCLKFDNAGTTTISVATTAASTGTVGISTTAASTATVGLGKTGITPAVAAPSTQTIYGAVSAPSSQTLTPAVAAPNTQTLTPAADNGKLTGSYTLTQKTPAALGSAVTVATGSVSSSGTGGSVVTNVSVGTTTGNVDVGYENSTVTVR